MYVFNPAMFFIHNPLFRTQTLGFISLKEETSGLSQKADLVAGRSLKTGRIKGLHMTSLMWKGLVKKENYWEPLRLVFR